MRKGQTKGEKGLSAPVRTRLTQRKFREIEELVKNTKGETTASLLRKIIEDKPIHLYYHEESLDLLMEELAALRSEIRSIGVNINQVTKRMHSDPEWVGKVFHGRQVFKRYLQLSTTIEQLVIIIDGIAKKWLSASGTGKTSRAHFPITKPKLENRRRN